MARLRLAIAAFLVVLGFGLVGGSNCDCDCNGQQQPPPPTSPSP